MSASFVAAPPFRRPLSRPKRRPRPCQIHCRATRAEVGLLVPVDSMSHAVAATQRSARVSILTDFSSNPWAAMADRASDPLSAVMLFSAAALGSLATFFARRPEERLWGAALGANESPALVQAKEEENGDDAIDVDTKRGFPGENAVWLNMSLRTLWRLFRKSTNGLVKEVLQPVLNEMEFPTFIKSVKISRLTLGESPALVREIKRLPSRALSEIQYQFIARLVGDKEGEIDMDVVIRLPAVGYDVTIPVTVSCLDIEARVWLGCTLVPYQPWIRFTQWALVDMPIVKLKLAVAKYIPVTAIPVLSNVLVKILTRDVPREFLFPKTQLIDLMDPEATNVDMDKEILASRGIDVKLDDVSEETLRESFPDLVSLFDALDVNNDGLLSPAELSSGLIEWGYASQADRNSIVNLLDVNKDGMLQLSEFIGVWGDLRNVFVPRRYRGVVSGVLLKAEGLRAPTIGGTDPYVVLRVEGQSTRSKRNKATSEVGKGRGCAVWNEGWELLVQQPKTAVLRVEVWEGCYFSYYKDYIAPPAQPTTHSGSGAVISAVERANKLDNVIGYGSIPIASLGSATSSVWVDLSVGGGKVRMDVQFSEFVDPQVR